MNDHFPKTVLRWGLAFVFFYSAISGMLRPEYWLGYFPDFMLRMMPIKILILGFSILEIILAGWLFWGRKLIWSSGIAVFLLALITIVNLNELDEVFRNVGLAMAALALFDMARNQSKTQTLKNL
jgi:hypothetical protein